MINRAMRRPAVVALATLAGSGLAGGVLASELAAQSDKAKKRTRAHAKLVDGKGKRVGTVRFMQRRSAKKVTVTVRARRLPPGFHGFHIHGMGRCDDPTFETAGSHFTKRKAADHPDHAGDMPTLLVARDGSAWASFRTDRFSIADLRKRDGSAVMVHAKADNHANIPTDRYDPDPDEATRNTGDAGDRIACGVVR